GSATPMARKDGRVLDVLADVVEVTEIFQPGESGSPIVRRDTGQVVALASYYTKEAAQELVDDAHLREPSLRKRWFAYRVDEPIAKLQRIELSALWKDWKFANDYADVTDQYESAIAAAGARLSVGDLSDYQKAGVITLLTKNALWDGRQVTA